MARTDLIADIFTIIRNASFVKKEWTQIPASNMIKSILDILKREGYIENFKVIESGTEQKQENLRVYLKYFENGLPALKNLKRISRSGLRVYAKSNKIPYVLRGNGLAIISTSLGLLTDKEARRRKIGGEVIGYIW